jgi:cytochrome P450
VPEVPELLGALFTPAGSAEPYPLYAALHELGDAFAPPRSSVWVVGYDAIDSVLRSPAVQVIGSTLLEAGFPDWREHPSMMSKGSVLDLNGTEHARVRAFMSGAFSRRRVDSLAPAISRLVDELVDEMAARGADGSAVEFMHDFAYLLPVTVICELIGIPQCDRESFRSIAADLVAGTEFTDGQSDGALAAADAATVKLNDYFAALAAERRDNPRDDLLSALVKANDAGDGRLSGTELLDNLNTLLLAGLVTTTNLLGNGLRIVLQDPVTGAGVRDGSIPVGGFVEEVLRYDSPIQMAERLAADHVQIGEIRVTPGTHITLLLGAGNRDPRQFTYPDRFDPLRSERGTLSFGVGPHFCLGAGIAKLEASIAFPKLLGRFPSMTIAGEPRRSASRYLRGFDSLPIVISPR